MQAEWFTWAFIVAVLVGLATMWFFLGERIVRSVIDRRNSSTVARAARAVGWRYRSGDSLTLPILGLPFIAGESWCTDIIEGEVHGESFTAFEYEHQYAVFLADLPAQLPLIDVRLRGLEGPAPVLEHTAVTLESEDFNRRFWVGAKGAKYASDLLNPRVMDQMLQAPPMCWRILARSLVAWRPGPLHPEEVVPIGKALLAVRRTIPAFVWTDHTVPDDEIA